VDAAYRARGMDPIAWTGDLGGFVEALVDLPLEFQPATAWNYGVSTDVVGHLVEVISGEPLGRFFAERIFAPLGMHDTGFHVPEASRGRVAGCYARDASGRLVPHHLRDFSVPPTAPSGGGGLVSTADDYLRFCEMVRRGGAFDGARLLGPKTVAFMLQNHLPGGRDLHALSVAMFSEGIYRGVGFGLGFAVVGDPVATGLAGSMGEAYWGGLASTSFWIDPLEGLSVVFLTQLIPSSSTTVRRELRQMVNGAILDSRAGG
jgi:CubicO group peptidase (beta-lactamase class C family)